MLFNSIEFLLFFVVVFFFYWKILSKSYAKQNLLLLCSSYFFYGWWDWRFLSLIIFSSFVDYFVGQKLGTVKDQTYRKGLLLISLIVNLGFLAYFKYFNFFIDSFAELLNQLGFQSNRSSLNIILPVGISFYTFQTLSYTIDIYRKEIEPTKSVFAFFTFVAFFPQLVAGPIERAKRLLPQFEKPRKFNYKFASNGAKLILIGFFKKMVIADNAARLVDVVYNDPSNYVGFPMLVATIFFAFQIYCDFSGYSDIAVGSAKLMGFNLINNFNKPYFATSINDFWRRWHISLSTWFRDYVYIPLGGNRKNRLKTYINILITFTISGLWHGANWTFVVWGAFHGIMLIINKLINDIKYNFKFISIECPYLLKVTITFIVTCFAWIFFRANSLNDAIFIINNMFIDTEDYFNLLILSTKFRGMGLIISDLFTVIIFIIILLIIDFFQLNNKLMKKFENSILMKWSFYYFILFSIIMWGIQNSDDNFIYFQF